VAQKCLTPLSFSDEPHVLAVTSSWKWADFHRST